MTGRWHAWIIGLSLVLAVAWGLPPTSAWAQAARVTAVRTADQLGLTILVELDRRVDPQVYTLDEPMRLVLDLAGARWALTEAPPIRGAVAGWRYGGMATVARLVVDLATPLQVRRVGYDLGAPRGVARLLVELEPTPREIYTAGVQAWRTTSSLFASVYTPPEALPTALPAPTAAQPTIASRPVPPDVAPGPVVQPPAATLPAVPVPAQAAQPASPANVQTTAPSAAAARPAGRIGPASRSAGRPVVVIDPGHGGQDPGAIGATGTYEKTITLAVSRELKRRLEASGRYRVHLTRDRDEFLRLRERVQRARNWKADMFISIHADSIGTSEMRGASVYTLSDTASDAEAAALAARENRADIIAGVDLSHESREVANILIDLAQRETLNRSAVLATLLVRELGREIRMLSVGPHRFAGFAVLRAPDVPAVLLELGYLSNRHDEALLKQADHRRKLATGIQRAIDAFFAKPTETASP